MNSNVNFNDASAQARMTASLVSGMTGFKVAFGSVPTAQIDLKHGLVTINKNWISLSPDNLLAVLLHECAGHGKRSDNSNMKIQSAAEASLLNVLEDVRIELAIFKDWPGAKRLLFGLTTLVFKSWTEPDSPEGALIMACLYFGRGVLLGQQAPLQHRPHADQALMKYISKNTWVAIQALIRDVTTMPSDRRGTAMCLTVTRQILAMFAAERKSSPDDEGDADGNAEGESKPDGKRKGKADDDAEGSSEGKADGESKPDGKGKGKTEGLCATDLGDLIAQAFDNSDDKMLDVQHETIGQFTPNRMALQMDVAPEKSMQRLGSKAFAELGDLFREMSTRAHTGYRRSGQTLNVQRAALAMTHDLEVFDTLSYGEGIDTAIAISIDCSSSMRGGFNMTKTSSNAVTPNAAEAAASLTAAVVEIAAEHNVPAYVNVFYDKFAGEVLGWEEPMRNGQSLATLYGGTRLDLAICDALHAFGTRRETNKVYIILTDGDTAFSTGCYNVLTSAAIVESGIKLLFIQLNTNTELGVRLAAAGHAVARANNYQELCSEVAVALKKLMNGVRIV